MQVTLYLSEELVRQVDQRAQQMNLSRSRYVQIMLRESLEGARPTNLLQAFGSIPELPSDLRQHLGEDVARPQL